MGDSYTFIDCPGSVEFIHDMRAALPAVDAAVVVCEADEKKIPQLQLILRELEDLNIPRFLFLNKIDKAETKRDARRCSCCSRPRASRWCCARSRSGRTRSSPASSISRSSAPMSTRSTPPSEVVPLEGESLDREKDARFSMLEKLADHDDELMEQLLEDIPPPRDKVFDDLAKELRDGLVVPGADRRRRRAPTACCACSRRCATRRPDVEATAKRLGVKPAATPVAYVLKTFNTAPCRQDVGRARAARARSATASRCCRPSARPAASPARSSCSARPPRSAAPAAAGETVALGKLEYAKTGDTLSAGKQAHARAGRGDAARRRCWRSRSRPRSARTTSSSARRCTSCVDEDPVDHASCTTPRPTRWCCGARARCTCASRPSGSPTASASPISTRAPDASATARPSRRAIVQRGRHKKQSGGHGQFGDVVLDIKPLPRGSGFKFEDKITGGVVPRNYIPSVEEGVDRRAQARPARLPGGRRVGDADRRLVSHRRFLRHGVPDRGPHRHRRGPAAMPAGAARADPSWSRSSARPTRPRR